MRSTCVYFFSKLLRVIGVILIINVVLFKMGRCNINITQNQVNGNDQNDRNNQNDQNDQNNRNDQNGANDPRETNGTNGEREPVEEEPVVLIYFEILKF